MVLGIFGVAKDVMCTAKNSVLCRPYGALSRADIKRNFAFVEFRRLEDAIKVGNGP